MIFNRIFVFPYSLAGFIARSSVNHIAQQVVLIIFVVFLDKFRIKFFLYANHFTFPNSGAHVKKINVWP